MKNRPSSSNALGPIPQKTGPHQKISCPLFSPAPPQLHHSGALQNTTTSGKKMPVLNLLSRATFLGHSTQSCHYSWEAATEPETLLPPWQVAKGVCKPPSHRKEAEQAWKTRYPASAPCWACSEKGVGWQEEWGKEEQNWRHLRDQSAEVGTSTIVQETGSECWKWLGYRDRHRKGRHAKHFRGGQLQGPGLLNVGQARKGTLQLQNVFQGDNS